MNQIKDPPLNYPAGTTFNYDLWTMDTEITLTNVPWNNDYRDCVPFRTTALLNEYIDGRPADFVKIAHSSYAKADQPIMLDMAFNLVNRYNYVRVYNPAQPAKGGDVANYFYYFITDVTYVAPNTTQVTVQLDIFQSYIRRVQFGRCYIDRGHIGIANEDHFQNNGRDFLTVPEGLDMGGEYVNVAERRQRIMGPNAGQYDILVISAVKLERDPGTENAPKLYSASGSIFQSLPSGAQAYLWTTPKAFLAFLNDYQDKAWATQGILSITLIPKVTRYGPYTYSPYGIGASQAPENLNNTIRHDMWTDWRYASEIRNYIPPRYRHLRKLYTYPFMAIEMTTWTATPVVLKPESWNSPHASIRESAALVPPNQRIVFAPLSYNSRTEPGPTGIPMDRGEHLDLNTQISNFPTMAIVNNGASAYMAANANSIAYGFQSADWSQSRALRGNATSYDQASAAMNAGIDATNNGVVADAAQTGISNRLMQTQALTGGIGGVASGAGMGAFAGPMGMVGGAAGGAASGVMSALHTANSVNAANESFNVRNSLSMQQLDVSQRQAGYMRDTNKGLADWAANGDYENTIAGLNAKVQDAKLIQPTTSGQMGGEALNLIIDNVEVALRWKMLDQGSLAIIGEYWLRYGYAVRRYGFLPDDLMVMSHFTYWKLTETYIRTAAIPESFKQVLRGIFEKGVTLWANPNDIGMIDPAVNVIKPGIKIEGYTPPPPVIPEPPIDPEPEVKRKKKNMLVFSTNDSNPGVVWALAGTSPGTDANWLETRSQVLANAFIAACGVTNPVPVSSSEFYMFKAQYLAPVQTAPAPEGE